MPRIITLILLLTAAGNTFAGGPYPTLSGIAAAADDAPVTTPPLPGIGPVTGRFTDRGTIYLRAAVAFGPPVTTIDGP